ncbi:MAG: hypothetical protein ACJATT_004293 [Myxococcota bacterium]|jgi:hypothetical protein
MPRFAANFLVVTSYNVVSWRRLYTHTSAGFFHQRLRPALYLLLARRLLGCGGMPLSTAPATRRFTVAPRPLCTVDRANATVDRCCAAMRAPRRGGWRHAGLTGRLLGRLMFPILQSGDNLSAAARMAQLPRKSLWRIGQRTGSRPGRPDPADASDRVTEELVSSARPTWAGAPRC